MKAFRRAAQTAFERAYPGAQAQFANVDRVNVDVALDGRREAVSLRLTDGELSWSCTCGEPRCAHARAALAFVTDAEPSAGEDRITDIWELTRGAHTDRRIVVQSDRTSRTDPDALVEVLKDLITAVVRVGADEGLSASIEEGLARLLAAAPVPLPLGVSRWVGRLKQAVADRDEVELARVLSAASFLVDDLSATDPALDSQARIVSWLGSRGDEGPSTTRVTDLTLLEIAREWLPGITRTDVERRYLADVASGRIYREERAPSAQTASIGPCPRLLNVWLAVTEQSAPPQRIRLLQYAVTPVIETESWAQLAQHAVRDFEPLLASYREAQATFAGLSEPFALLSPSAIHGASLVDANGRLLPMFCSESPSVPRYLESLAHGGELLWVAGRLVDRDGVLGVCPLSAAAKRQGRVCYFQM
jgi:hypothetical protein